MAQSIAGGGGASSTSEGTKIGLGSVANIQQNSIQANSGNVNLVNTGNISTIDDGSAAILVQSIGGGGGYISQTDSGDSEYVITVGSSGNIDTRSGDITVENTAKRIQTEGTYSPGLTIQSIGGGGGFALIDARSKDETRIGAVDSNSDSASGSIKLTNNSDIVTLNRSSNALTVQTISSGGGVINSSSGNLSLGSKNVAGNDTSSSIDITNTGSITTLGARSSGLLVQSISSGGGVVAGRSLNGELVLGSTEENQTSNNDDSGAITVTNTATSITTYGRDSNAFVVQSIAGGGGYVARSEEKLTLGSTNETNVNSGDLDVYNASTIIHLGMHQQAL